MAGFIVRKTNGCYSLDKSSPYFKDISTLVHFTEEEAYILKRAIESVDGNTSLKQNLKEKLYKVNAARKSKVDDNTARMQSIKQLGV